MPPLHPPPPTATRRVLPPIPPCLHVGCICPMSSSPSKTPVMQPRQGLRKKMQGKLSPESTADNALLRIKCGSIMQVKEIHSLKSQQPRKGTLQGKYRPVLLLPAAAARRSQLIGLAQEVSDIQEGRDLPKGIIELHLSPLNCRLRRRGLVLLPPLRPLQAQELKVQVGHLGRLGAAGDGERAGRPRSRPCSGVGWGPLPR